MPACAVPARAQDAALSREPVSIADLIRQRNMANKGQPSAADRSMSADALVQMAESLVQSDQCDVAADDYRKAARLYAAEGKPEEAASAQMQAFHYESRLELFVHRNTDWQSVQRYNTRRRLEPVYGCYLGAGIETEKSLPMSKDSTTRHYRDCTAFNSLIGKRHAIFLDYMKYGSPFPVGFIATCKAAGAGAILAVEPDSLDMVQDDQTLAGFVDSIRRADIPIFVRFASEMNGEWTPYHRNHDLYKEKFRLVAQAVHAACPKAAMVWCSNDIPEEQISKYYPGPDAVDWVGVDFYSAYFRDNNLSDAIPWRNPADKLDYIYRTYSSIHPIMIGETGMAYQQSCDNVLRVDYAKSKLAELYQALPRRYPRVKAVVYLSMNAIHDSLNPRRRLNNYSLIDNDDVRSYYASMISPHYFLSQVDTGNQAASPTEYVPLGASCVVNGIVPISAYVKTYSESPTVTLTLNDSVVDAASGYDPHVWQIDTTKLPDGPCALKVSVSVGSRVVGESAVSLLVGNHTPPASAQPASARQQAQP